MAKRNKKVLYIYKVTCLVNNKVYIGQHSGSLIDGYMGSGRAILKAIKIYGVRNFVKEILCVCKDRKEADKLEIDYIIKFNSRDCRFGYNILKGGFYCTTSIKSSKLTFLEGKLKADPYSNYKQHYEKMMTTAFKSEEMMGENNPFYGRRHSEDSKYLIRQANLKREDELREKMNKLWQDEDFKEKLRNRKRVGTTKVIRVDIVNNRYKIFPSIQIACNGNRIFCTNVANRLKKNGSGYNTFYNQFKFYYFTVDLFKKFSKTYKYGE